SLTPNSGSVDGQTLVTLSGQAFAQGTSVFFDGISCTSVTFVSPSVLSCLTPAHLAGTVDVTVTNPDGFQSTLAHSFTYAELSSAPPSLTGLSPGSGGSQGGTVLTLSGAGFQKGATVLVGGMSCTDVQASASQITCKTPAHIAGAVDVLVSNPDSQSAIKN